MLNPQIETRSIFEPKLEVGMNGLSDANIYALKCAQISGKSEIVELYLSFTSVINHKTSYKPPYLIILFIQNLSYL